MQNPSVTESGPYGKEIVQSMEFTYSYKADLGIIEITAVGAVSSNALKNEQTPIFTLAKEHSTDMFLLDLTNYEKSLTPFDILDSVSYYNDKTNMLICIAVLAPILEEARQDVRFYETVCVNRGWNVRVFSKRQEAINWLVNR